MEDEDVKKLRALFLRGLSGFGGIPLRRGPTVPKAPTLSQGRRKKCASPSGTGWNDSPIVSNNNKIPLPLAHTHTGQGTSNVKSRLPMLTKLHMRQTLGGGDRGLRCMCTTQDLLNYHTRISDLKYQSARSRRGNRLVPIPLKKD